MFPLLELETEGMHGGMMVSKRQYHPISRSEVVAKIHFLRCTLGVKVVTKSISIHGMHGAKMASQW